jgi:hypothetical protein
MGESIYLERLLYSPEGEEGTEAVEWMHRREDVQVLVESARTTIPRIRNSLRVKAFLTMNRGCIEDVMSRCILPILSQYREELDRYKAEYEQKGDTAQFQQHRKNIISQLLQGAEEQHPTLFHLAETVGQVKYLRIGYDIRAHAKELLMDPKVYAQCIDLVLPYLSR